ncbi:ribosome small subunit-dependent GTPase A [Flavobacteriaceae bacterium]|jgi:ribosome biogenesis GTPase / thiamine phosphate phosphatase|nr:ribosome small subunit-dependent GTPase A [Flavobacteriaceae bacterium]MDC0622776.1 ribosome small subunit-dependent GTPase A [Flavobacteriaceae bacterium]
MRGLVYKSTGSWYSVKTPTNEQFDCRIKGKFRLDGIKSTNPIAVGDYVDFELEKNSDVVTGVINNICERKNYVLRKSVNLSKQTHILASNIDVVFLIITISSPVTSTNFIDRFLLTSNAYSINTILLFNKIDLLDEAEKKILKKLIDIYTNIGYECYEISAKNQYNIDKVQSLMKDKVSMFGGHSGVGKSTLINSLQPNLNLRTNNISVQHAQGQHTTTNAELYDLDFGAKIIDTPGIRGFGIVDFNKSDIKNYFPEFYKLVNQCKFNDCMHVNEPKCIVKQSVDEGTIANSRYENYLQILEDDKSSYRVDNFDV